MFIHFFSFPLTREIYQIPKSKDMVLLSISYVKTIHFKPQNQLGKGVPHEAQKKWLIKGLVNKVLGLDG